MVEVIRPQGGQVPQGVQVPQGENVPIVGKGYKFLVVPPDMTNGEIRESLLTLARVMTAQVHRDSGA